VLAVALAFSSTAALSVAMDDVVKTRADQNIDQQYGRDSVYGFSPDSKPLTPERTANTSRVRGLSSEDSMQSLSSDDSIQNQSTQSSALSAASDSSDIAPQQSLGSGYTEYAVGSGYTGTEQSATQPWDSAIGDSTAREYDPGYYREPEERTVLLPYDEDTAHQGYYENDDQIGIVIVLPDGTAMEDADASSPVAAAD